MMCLPISLISLLRCIRVIWHRCFLGYWDAPWFCKGFTLIRPWFGVRRFDGASWESFETITVRRSQNAASFLPETDHLARPCSLQPRTLSRHHSQNWGRVELFEQKPIKTFSLVFYQGFWSGMLSLLWDCRVPRRPNSTLRNSCHSNMGRGGHGRMTDSKAGKSNVKRTQMVESMGCLTQPGQQK